MVERLEERSLLTFVGVGSPPPELAVTALAPTIAAYGGQIAVTAYVQNLGASSIAEPTALDQNATSTADAPPFSVGVFLSKSHRFTPRNRSNTIKLGTIDFENGLRQNSADALTGTFAMPTNRPRGFPGSNQKAYVFLRADEFSQVPNNIGYGRGEKISYPVAVTIAPALPNLSAIAIDAPPVIQPGDTIAPSIQIANFGTADTDLQSPVLVLLVASSDKNFGPTDVVVGRYVIDNIPPLSTVPQSRAVFGDVNVVPPNNVVTVSTTEDGEQNLTLPTGGNYFLGVVVDPFNEIRELDEVGRFPSPRLQLLKRVVDVPGLPPAGVLSDPSPAENVFPFPAFGADTFGSLELAPTAASVHRRASENRPITQSIRVVARRPVTSPTTKFPSDSKTTKPTTNPNKGSKGRPSPGKPIVSVGNPAPNGKNKTKPVRMVDA